jgi:hypothetical protein
MYSLAALDQSIQCLLKICTTPFQAAPDGPAKHRRHPPQIHSTKAHLAGIALVNAHSGGHHHGHGLLDIILHDVIPALRIAEIPVDPLGHIRQPLLPNNSVAAQNTTGYPIQQYAEGPGNDKRKSLKIPKCLETGIRSKSARAFPGPSQTQGWRLMPSLLWKLFTMPHSNYPNDVAFYLIKKTVWRNDHLPEGKIWKFGYDFSGFRKVLEPS